MEKKLTNLDDAELIREAMRLQRSRSVSLIESTEKNNQKILKLQENAILKKKSFDQGYELCIKELESHSTNETSLEDNPLTAKTYEMEEEAKKTVDSMEFWTNYLQNSTKIQYLVNYSDEMLLELYDLARIYYENKHHQKAIKIYTFLTLLNPDIPSFWVGLGLALEDNNQILEAIETFEKAIAITPHKFTAYLGLIRCSEKLQDFNKISAQLTKACENEELKGDAIAALEYISSKTEIGG